MNVSVATTLVTLANYPVKGLAFTVKVLYTTLVITPSGCGAVDSALGLGPRGRRFESFHPDHKRTYRKKEPSQGFFLFCVTRTSKLSS